MENRPKSQQLFDYVNGDVSSGRLKPEFAAWREDSAGAAARANIEELYV